jgi:hypothetical protein
MSRQFTEDEVRAKFLRHVAESDQALNENAADSDAGGESRMLSM